MSIVLSHVSRLWFFVTPWTIARQTPLSMGFTRQEYWSGLPFRSPGDLPNPGIKPTSLASPALAGELFITSTTWEALKRLLNRIITSPLPSFPFSIWARCQLCEDPPVLFMGGSRAITWLTVDFQYAFVEWRKESMKSQVLSGWGSMTIYGRAKPILLPPQGLWTHTCE